MRKKNKVFTPKYQKKHIFSSNYLHISKKICNFAEKFENTKVESIKKSDVISKTTVADVTSKTDFQPQSQTQFVPVSIANFIRACQANKADITEEEIVKDICEVR